MTTTKTFLGSRTSEDWVIGGVRLSNVHSRGSCTDDDACFIHNPSEHHMVDWPVEFEYVLGLVLALRVCEHDEKHVDPDSFAWLKTQISPQTAAVVDCTDCDGCCR